MQVILRLAEPDDYPDLISIIEKRHLQLKGGPKADYCSWLEIAEKRLKSALQKSVEHPSDHAVYLAEARESIDSEMIQDKILGLGVVHRGAGRAYLELLFVEEDGRGVGTALIQKKLQHAREEWSCQWALADVMAGSCRSIRLLEKCGFSAAAKIDDPILDAEVVLMARGLR